MWRLEVISGFDLFPKSTSLASPPVCWTLGPSHGVVGNKSGPIVLMDFINHRPLQYPGEILPPAMFFVSWAMSPRGGVSVRRTTFTRALDNCMPIDADLWAERTILALMGMRGP